MVHLTKLQLFYIKIIYSIYGLISQKYQWILGFAILRLFEGPTESRVLRQKNGKYAQNQGAKKSCHFVAEPNFSFENPICGQVGSQPHTGVGYRFHIFSLS